MSKVIVSVPDGTIAKKCGEKYMACILDDEGTLKRCTEFFKTREAAEEFVKENPEYLFFGVNYTGVMPKGTAIKKVPREAAV